MDPVTVSYACSFCFGLFYFFILYKGCLQILQKCCLHWKLRNPSDIAGRFVSAAQAIHAIIAGLIIHQNTKDNILYSTHWLANYYSCVGLSYFFCDTWAMYEAYLHDSSRDLAHRSGTFSQFCRKNVIMLAHHLFMVGVFGPVIFILRGDVGDFFISVVFLTEVPLPFVHFRGLLLQLGAKDGPVYVVNGFLLTVLWFFFRILAVPYLLWKYSVYAEIPLVSIPLTIPYICTVTSTIIIAANTYWWSGMVAKVFKFCFPTNPAVKAKNQ